MHTALIIPALDEETAIGAMLEGIDRSIVHEIIVADNGSRDRTAEIAASRGASVVSVAQRGYGAACAGALEMISADVDTVLFMDGDGSDDPAEIPLVLGPIARGEAELVIGSRVLGRAERGALTPQQRFGNWLATLLIRRLYGHAYTDLGPFRAIRRDLLDRIAMRDRRYGWTVEMQLRAVQLGARVVEVPVSCRRRVGRSKISGTVGGVYRAGRDILGTIWRLRR